MLSYSKHVEKTWKKVLIGVEVIVKVTKGLCAILHLKSSHRICKEAVEEQAHVAPSIVIVEDDTFSKYNETNCVGPPHVVWKHVLNIPFNPTFEPSLPLPKDEHPVERWPEEVVSSSYRTPCRDNVRVLRLIHIPVIVFLSVLFLEPLPEPHARRLRIVVVRQMHIDPYGCDDRWNCSVHNRGEQYYIEPSRIVCLIWVQLIEALGISLRISTLIFSALLVSIQVHELISQVHSRIHWDSIFFFILYITTHNYWPIKTF